MKILILVVHQIRFLPNLFFLPKFLSFKVAYCLNLSGEKPYL